MPRPLSLAFLVVLASASAAQSPPLLQPTGRALNGGPLKNVVVTRTSVTFYASEPMQSADLNGDGDQADVVAQVHDLRTGVTRSLAAVSYLLPPVASDRYSGFGVSEGLEGGLDRNGDGDADDDVACVFDRATGQMRNLGIAMKGTGSPDRPLAVITDRVFAFIASETGQGADLDGDGVVGHCLYVVDLATGVGSGVAPQPAEADYEGRIQFTISATRVYWRALVDNRLWVHDCATSATTSLGWRVFAPPVARGGLVAFGISEYGNGQQDLTGDGDASDQLVGVVPASGGSPIVLRLEGWFFEFGAHLLIGTRTEAGPLGGDWNGDGDRNDDVGFLYDDRTNTVRSLGRTLMGWSWDSHAPMRFLGAVDGDVVAYAISEYYAGQDLNGDGDLTDAVTEVVDRLGNVLALAPVAIDHWRGNAIQLSRGWLGIIANEGWHGQDLDGDGQIGLDVPLVLDLTHSLGPVSLGIGTTMDLATSIHFDRNRASLVTYEGGMQGDLNGDGDVLDRALVVRGTTPGSYLNTPVAMWSVYGAQGVRGRDGVVAAAAWELQSGHGSLNGDADEMDQVLFVLRMHP